jgi:hypothetical protein
MGSSWVVIEMCLHGIESSGSKLRMYRIGFQCCESISLSCCQSDVPHHWHWLTLITWHAAYACIEYQCLFRYL